MTTPAESAGERSATRLRMFNVGEGLVVNRLISFFLSLAIVCSVVVAAGAQESRATLSGLITDPSSAPVVGAKITVIEVRTGTKTATVSDSAGQYTVPFLAPGDYEVDAEAQGFKQFVRRAIHIESGSH